MKTELDTKWIVDDNTPAIADPLLNPMRFGLVNPGLVERDFTVQPYQALPSEMKTHPMKEWPERIRDKFAAKSRLSDIRNRSGKDGGPIPFLLQGRWGYCWGHDAVHMVMLARGKMGLPYIAMSAFSVCAMIMKGANNGGWAALAIDWIVKNGVGPQALWPQGSVDLKLWTLECQAEASKYKISEGWWDGALHPGLRKLSKEQLGTNLLDSNPVALEYNDMSHSMAGLDLNDEYPNKDPEDPSRYSIDHLNSWPNYGVNGVGRRAGMKAWPDTSAAITSVNPV